MMLTQQQFAGLLQMVLTVEPDALGCDDCFGRVAEYAEYQLAHRELPVALQAIGTHLQQCPCCRDEYQALLEGLQALASTSDTEADA